MLKDSIGRLRFVGILEGISFLLLLGLAMPLKYMAGMEMAVTIAGSLHGLLFILYIGTVAHAMYEHKWKIIKTIVVALASIIPFAPFVLDRKLKEENQWIQYDKGMTR